MGGKGYEKNAPASVRTMGTQDRGRLKIFMFLSYNHIFKYTERSVSKLLEIVLLFPNSADLRIF